MQVDSDHAKVYKISKVDANAWKTQLFQKICPKFSNSSVVAAGPGATYPYLQPAVDRQPGHRRGDREKVGRNIEETHLNSALYHSEIILEWFWNDFKIFLNFQKNITFFDPPWTQLSQTIFLSYRL